MFDLVLDFLSEMKRSPPLFQRDRLDGLINVQFDFDIFQFSDSTEQVWVRREDCRICDFVSDFNQPEFGCSGTAQQCPIIAIDNMEFVTLYVAFCLHHHCAASHNS